MQTIVKLYLFIYIFVGVSKHMQFLALESYCFHKRLWASTNLVHIEIIFRFRYDARSRFIILRTRC